MPKKDITKLLIAVAVGALLMHLYRTKTAHGKQQSGGGQ